MVRAYQSSRSQRLYQQGKTQCIGNEKYGNLYIRHPSAENLITLGRKHHDGTTCHMSLWQKVSVSGKTESP